MPIKVQINSSSTYNLITFDPVIFEHDMTLQIITDDFSAIKNAFQNIELLEIFNNDNLIGSYSCFNSFSDISLLPSQYNSTENKFCDVMKVTLTKTNIIDQVQRLEEQLNPTVDIDAMSLEEHKNFLQDKNKTALATFLSEQSVIFKEKPYGVSEEDQSEMALNLMQYQALSAAGQEVSLEWHSKKSACEPFSVEDFVALTAMIKTFVYPYYQQMQTIKEQIFTSTTKEELKNITIEYVLTDTTTPPQESTDQEDTNTEK